MNDTLQIIRSFRELGDCKTVTIRKDDLFNRFYFIVIHSDEFFCFSVIYRSVFRTFQICFTIYLEFCCFHQYISIFIFLFLFIVFFNTFYQYCFCIMRIMFIFYSQPLYYHLLLQAIVFAYQQLIQLY